MSVLSKKKTFFNLFPPPEFLLLSTSGVAISDKSVKFVQLRRNSFSTKRHLAKWGKVPLPEGVVEAGFINSVEHVASALKTLAASNKLHFVRASLPDEKAYLFSAIIDKVPEESLRDAVAFILEENVPVSLADSVFDFRTIELAQPGKVKVVVSVAHKKVVESYYSVFDAAGMAVISFDLEAEAIARAVMARGDDRPTLIVNAGQRKMSFYVVEKGVVQFSTTSVRELVEPNTPIDIRNLKSEMQKVFAFWNTKIDAGFGEEKKITNIVLCGAPLSDKNIVSELSTDFPVEYALANPWINTVLPRSNSAILPESLEFVSAIGLALFQE
jgi:Tfp pilus assembly PilM family ATPase